MSGGTAQVDNKLTVHPGSKLWGRGTVEVRGRLNNNGYLWVSHDTLTLSNLGSGQFDLDGKSEDGSVEVGGGSVNGHLVVDGPLADAFDGTMSVSPGSATFHEGWTLGPNGTLKMKVSTRLAGSHTVALGDINVTGSARVSSPIEFGSSARVVVNDGSELRLNGATTFRGGSYTGAGVIRQNASATVKDETTISVDRYDMDGASENSVITIKAPFLVDVDKIDFCNNRFDGTVNVDTSFPRSDGRLTVLTEAGQWDMNGTMNLNSAWFLPLTVLSGSHVNVNGRILADGQLAINSTLTLGSGFGKITTNDEDTVVMLSGTGRNEMHDAWIVGPGRIAASSGTTLVGSGWITANVDFRPGSRLLAETGPLCVFGPILDMGTIGTANDSGVLVVAYPWNTAVASDRLELNGGEVNGGVITNDGLTSGRGSIMPDFVNSNKVEGPDPASSDWLNFFGDVAGCGSFTGNVKFWGSYDPGCSAAAVSLENVEFADTAVLKLEIGGLEPGTDYDELNISGDAAFGGTLNLIFFDGFAPSTGDTFDVIHVGGSIHGGFAETNYLNLDPGFEFTTEFVEPGVFRLTTIAVPEPSTIVLAASGLLGVVAYGWRRRRRVKS